MSVRKKQCKYYASPMSVRTMIRVTNIAPNGFNLPMLVATQPVRGRVRVSVRIRLGLGLGVGLALGLGLGLGLGSAFRVRV